MIELAHVCDVGPLQIELHAVRFDARELLATATTRREECEKLLVLARELLLARRREGAIVIEDDVDRIILPMDRLCQLTRGTHRTGRTKLKTRDRLDWKAGVEDLNLRDVDPTTILEHLKEGDIVWITFGSRMKIRWNLCRRIWKQRCG